MGFRKRLEAIYLCFCCFPSFIIQALKFIIQVSRKLKTILTISKLVWKQKKITEWGCGVVVSRRPDEHDDGDADDSGQDENDEGDDDDDGGVAQEPMFERVVRAQLHDGSAQYRPGEEALARGTNPRLKYKYWN